MHCGSGELVKRASQLVLGLLLALALQGMAMAQSATVMTDQADYAPGTIVTITGSGWQPGETVTLQLVESPLIDTHPDMTAVADENGNIFNSQFSPDSHDVDITFTLTATGGTSGLQAQTTFTDSNNNITFTTAPFSIAVGACSPTITFTDSGSGTTTLSSSSGTSKFYDTLAHCTAHGATGQVTNINNNGGASFFYTDTTAGNPTITLTGGNTATQTETIVGPPSKLVFTSTPVTVTVAVCSAALTVQSQDSSGNPSNVTSTETLAPSGPAGASFYIDNTCTTVVTGSNLTIPGGSNSATFFFKDTVAGSPVVTVTGTGVFTANGANAATQTETVNAATARRGQTIIATLSPMDRCAVVALQ